LAEFKTAYAAVGGSKNYYPHLVGDKAKLSFKELQEIVGYPNFLELGNYQNIFGNFAVPALGLPSAIAAGIHKIDDKFISRRKLLFGLILGLAGISGIVIGDSLTTEKETYASQAKQKADYLDSVIQQVYHKK